MLQNGLLVWPWWHYIFHNKWHEPRSINTIAYNYLSTRVTKTFSVGQSKFKVLTVKLQSLPAHFGTFWRHSIKGSNLDQQRVRAFCLWSFENQNECKTPGFHLDAYSALHWKNTNRYILPFGGPANCVISFMTFF